MVSGTAKRRILVTGASGFVGQTFLGRALDHLSDAVEIIPTDRSPSKSGYLALDVTDAEAVDRLIAELRPEGVLHLAGMAAVSEATRQADLAWAVNFHGALNVARAVARHTADARFVFVSSADVYGGSFSGAKNPLDETALLDPLTVYAATKAAADLVIGQMVHDGLNAVRFRAFNHTGPGQADKFVVASFAKQIARIERGLEEPVVSVGNMDIRRDFLDVRDVVDAYLHVLDPRHEFPRGGIFNLASGTTRRIGEVLNELLSRSSVSIHVSSAPERMRSNEMPVTLGDSARAKAKLGWTPRVPWAQTLSDTLDFARRSV